ncbi:hypothetical protein ABH931_002618 [Streptacidiphilus sp. MAP12-33]
MISPMKVAWVPGSATTTVGLPTWAWIALGVAVVAVAGVILGVMVADPRKAGAQAATWGE